jgi:hypothetical protein
MSELYKGHLPIPPPRSRHAAWASLTAFSPRAVVVMALLAVVAFSDTAFARKSSHSNRNNAAAAAARKKQTIASIQLQVAAAQQVLAAAESAGGASQAKLDDIRQRMISARQAMTEAVDEEREVRENLQETEEKVLADQSAESEFGRVKAQLAAARAKVEEFRAQYGNDWGGLKADAGYCEALESLIAAKREYDPVRAAVLAADQDWQEASQKHRKIRAEHEEEQRGAGGSLNAMTAGRNLRNAAAIAAEARQVIAVGEMRLRQLGAKVPASASTAMAKKATVKK